MTSMCRAWISSLGNTIIASGSHDRLCGQPCNNAPHRRIILRNWDLPCEYTTNRHSANCGSGPRRPQDGRNVDAAAPCQTKHQVILKSKEQWSSMDSYNETPWIRLNPFRKLVLKTIPLFRSILQYKLPRGQFRKQPSRIWSLSKSCENCPTIRRKQRECHVFGFFSLRTLNPNMRQYSGILQIPSAVSNSIVSTPTC